MNARRALAGAALLLGGVLGAACATFAKEVESLDPAQCSANEGIVVVRFLTSRADEEDLEHPERDPDIDYSVEVTNTAARLSLALPEGYFSVKGEKGAAQFVRKLEAGDHYFHEISFPVGAGRVSFPITVKFTVQPGRVTYVGDLEILFVEAAGVLMNSNWRCQLRVGDDLPAVLRELRNRFPVVPPVETVPMTVE
jgi:hypothetical protein